ncbi:MAG: hypothetical protein C0501_03270 [Isosphaera sp.]|nr:hypothetical protein [Isosphaera sp.]
MGLVKGLKRAVGRLIGETNKARLRRALDSVGERIGERRRVARLRRIVASAPAPHPQLFGGVDDDYWLWLNTEGVRQDPRLAQLLPSLPDETLQVSLIGLTGDTALRDGYTFYRLVKQLYARHVGPLPPTASVMDFGCGWGRTIRFFLKDVAAENLCGVDAYPDAFEAVRQTNRWCDLRMVDPFGPTPFPADKFDLIYAYSVFSHLPENVHELWLAELRRVLKPGGLLVATTWQREFILECEERNRAQHDILRYQEPVFGDKDRHLAEYDAGQFCHWVLDHHNPPERRCWGETCIPRAYVEKNWTRLFDLCEYIDDRNVCPQNVIVVRKPS